MPMRNCMLKAENALPGYITTEADTPVEGILIGTVSFPRVTIGGMRGPTYTHVKSTNSTCPLTPSSLSQLEQFVTDFSYKVVPYQRGVFQM